MTTEEASTSSQGARNRNLGAARAARQDEFYTQWADIEREMNAYLEYDPDVFRDKVLLCPCDDPEWSNFTKFFALHLSDYGIKKLISTSYAPDSNPATSNYQPTLFESTDPKFDSTKTHANGKVFTLESRDLTGDGVINIDDLAWEYLEGDGDFRSAEVTRCAPKLTLSSQTRRSACSRNSLPGLMKAARSSRSSVATPRPPTTRSSR